MTKRPIRCKVCRVHIGTETRWLLDASIGLWVSDPEYNAEYGAMFDYDGRVCRDHVGSFPANHLIYTVAEDGEHVAAPGFQRQTGGAR